MYYNLFLDDERFPQQVTWVNLPAVEWQIVRNYNEFVETIKRQGAPYHVSFDNDLADEHYSNVLPEDKDGNFKKINASFKEKTGYDCAKFLVNYCRENDIKFPYYTVHSMNPVGKENIIALIESYKRVFEA